MVAIKIYRMIFLRTILSCFKKDDFDNLRTSHGEMLINFIKAAKFNENLFEEMMLTYDSGRKQDLIDDLKELIEKKNQTQNQEEE